MTNNQQITVIYREEHTKTWFKVTGVHDLRSELTQSHGLSLVFESEVFGTLRSGGFMGEMVVIQYHDHATDVRYAAKVMFEYLSNENHFWVRANAREAVLPTVPIEWKNLVLEQNHMLHYTGESFDINPFLALVSHNDLTLENSKVLGSQTVIPLQTTPINPDRTWGRRIAKPVSMPAQPLPGKSWFERLFRRA